MCFSYSLTTTFTLISLYSWTSLVRSPKGKGKWLQLTRVRINEVKISSEAFQGEWILLRISEDFDLSEFELSGSIKENIRMRKPYAKALSRMCRLISLAVITSWIQFLHLPLLHNMQKKPLDLTTSATSQLLTRDVGGKIFGNCRSKLVVLVVKSEGLQSGTAKLAWKLGGGGGGGVD